MPKPGLTISNLLYEDYDFTPEDAAEIEDFLLPMLEFDPAKRISARDCLKSAWLWSWQYVIKYCLFSDMPYYVLISISKLLLAH